MLNSDKAKGKKKPDDVALLLGKSDDGELLALRAPEEAQLQLMRLRPLKDGEAVTGQEILQLKPRPKTPRICDVDVIYRPEPEAHGGPARVSSERYRRGWERLFGPVDKDLLN